VFLVSDYIRAAGKGTCYVCRAHRRSRDEIIIDLGREIEFEGALQVCASCIKEAAGLTGALAEATDAVATELALVTKERDELGTALDAAETAMDAMKLYRATPRKVRPAAEDSE
jgi:hypothetical protein